MEIVCLGELIAEFLPYGMSENGYPLFEFNPGGAPANVAAAVTKLGVASAFIGKVGNDLLGNLLYQALHDKGVAVRGIVQDADEKTTISIVYLADNGERSFCFFGEHPADMALNEDDLDTELIKQAKIFHFGARSLLSPISKKAIQVSISCAKENNILISFDPNLRAALWPDTDSAKKDGLWGIEQADLIKLSMDEMHLLMDGEEIDDVLREMERKGKTCIVTDADKGAYILENGIARQIPSFSVEAIDTTGAGDAFWGAFLYFIIKQPEIPISEKVRLACAAGALTTLKKGAITAQPTLNEIYKLANSQSI